MKRLLSLFLALAIFLVLCTVSAAEEMKRENGTVGFPYAGIRIELPEVYRNTTGTVIFDFGDVDDGPDGMYAVGCHYYALPEETVALLMDKNNRDVEVPQGAVTNSLFVIFSIPGGMTLQRYAQLSGDPYPAEQTRELGSAGGRNFYLYFFEQNPYFIEDVDPLYRDEYIALSGAAEEIAAACTLFAPEEKPDPYAGLIGKEFAFTTVDLDGNPVSSAELFVQSKVTMVNIFATWCGPCEGELNDISGIYTRYREKGCNVVGFLVDDDYDLAREQIVEHHVAYPVLLAPENLGDYITLEGYPTTLFFGPDGMLLTDPVVGAHVERYPTILNSLLRK